MMIVGFVDQTIIGLFKVNEEVKLNTGNSCDFMERLSLHGTSASLAVSK